MRSGPARSPRGEQATDGRSTPHSGPPGGPASQAPALSQSAVWHWRRPPDSQSVDRDFGHDARSMRRRSATSIASCWVTKSPSARRLMCVSTATACGERRGESGSLPFLRISGATRHKPGDGSCPTLSSAHAAIPRRSSYEVSSWLLSASGGTSVARGIHSTHRTEPKPLDAEEDLVGSLCPDEGLGTFIADGDVVEDGRLERACAAMGPAANLLLRQQREPAFHEIQPRCPRRREVQMIAGCRAS